MHFVHDLTESLTPGSAVISIGDKRYEESIKRWAVTAEKRAFFLQHHQKYRRQFFVPPSLGLRHGLATVGGTVNLTGMGGLTLGGGYGYLSGAYGTVVDNLLSVQMVLASGEIITVSERQYPELFWAVRRAGAASGVVTEFVFRAHKQENLVWASMLAFPPDKLSSILECANHVIDVSKGEATTMVGFATPQLDLPSCIMTVVFYNGPEQSAKALFEPILKLDPLLNTTAMIPYPEVNTFHNTNVPDGARRTMKDSTFTTPVDIPFVESMFNDYVSFIQSTPDAQKTLILYEFISPHKIMSVPQNATSFANHGPYGNVVFVTAWTDPEHDTVCREWTRNMARKARNQLLKTRGAGEGVGEYANYEGRFPSPYE
ncbi:hypothetical protein SS1G_00485 [Sclerotinia sclerotiorum 1980 UF-70]|uniref:FAD-binding PCMH-type domain-containing protein n=2 Tax=Sclerotinia sclerotiorum (strain ATCC 18683 / 1980 / Ss-1) TaxID=665079 RepID=A7E5B1_SCLS1|nr:hypothetical protein SS1G_00485 [Sclerotinia sclerotiorum 1980 UF-70]APA07901.1 hypothetical protein sscle_03g026710 [Sclerotinia sclerotiorum 1980 UF-70]EDN91083.1 hypothetical protein SS1G_00485 [Sclerotinia sclerotiorum 1980 UF-70]